MTEKDLQDKRSELVSKFKQFFSSEKTDSPDPLAQKRKKVISFFKENKTLLFYCALILIIWLGVSIRVSNFPLLKDVTTGEMVSTDLDSHIYYKYAKEILNTGTLSPIDHTRFIPLGAPTANYAFPAYTIYGLYQFLHFFDSSITIDYVDVIYPIIAFAIGVIFFFLIARRVFGNYVGLLGSLFLAVMPAFLQRTMGGSSDHDALGIMFFFISLYLFLVAWQAVTTKKALIWGVLAGIATGLTGLSWGAWKFVALIFSVFVLVEYLFRKVESRQMYVYALWFISAIIVMVGWVPLFPLKSLVTSVTTILSVFVLVVLAIDFIIFQKNWLGLKQKMPQKLPSSFVSIILAFALGIIGLIILIGPMHLTSQLSEAKSLLLHPMGKDRWELTVAEQHQPYFKDIINSFNPQFVGIPALYFLFLVGAILAFYTMVKENKHTSRLVSVYVGFILLLMLTRYSSSGVLNGKSTISILLYFGSFVALAALMIYFIFRTYHHDKSTYDQLKSWNSGILMLLIWALFMVVAARGAVRLIFIFAPVVALFAAYALVELSHLCFAIKNKGTRAILLILLALVVISPLAAPFQGIIPDNYGQSKKQATYSGPPYNQPWQRAGAWVRENTPQDAVFAHWWDYGYWVQNGFERSSVLDGANKVKYWNFLMGRHVLTGQTQEEALQFLSVHNATNMLIVSDDIGKYTAYSSIGSDKDYDRYSWITTFMMNPKGTQETRNSTVLMFQGSYALDDDFTWDGHVFPRQGAGIGAVFVPLRLAESNASEGKFTLGQPTIALVENGKRTDVPLRCLFVNGQMVKYSTKGYNGCFRIMPILKNDGTVESSFGAGLFVSEEGMNALWTNLYVFDQKNPDFNTSAFELIYGENEAKIPLVIINGQLIGPIKIWKINYPTGFVVDEQTKKEYLGGNEYLPDYFFEVN